MPRLFRSSLAVSCVLSLLGSTSPAWAQEDVATKRFQEGRDAAKREDYATACPKFRESFALAAKAGTLLNLADCEEKTGKLASSLGAYTRLLEMLPVGDDRIGLVRDRKEQLEKLVPRVVIRSDAGDITKMSFDDSPLPTSQIGVAFPVDRGGHILVVERTNRPALRIELVVKDGERREIRIPAAEMTPAAPSARKQEDPPPTRPVPLEQPAKTSGGTIPTVAYVAGGVGAAGIIVSAITGVMALSKKSTMKDHCNERVECDATGFDAASSGKTLSTVSTVGFAVGLVGLGVGGYFALTSKPDAPAVGVRVLPGGGALGLGGAF